MILQPWTFNASGFVCVSPCFCASHLRQTTNAMTEILSQKQSVVPPFYSWLSKGLMAESCQPPLSYYIGSILTNPLVKYTVLFAQPNRREQDYLSDTLLTLPAQEIPKSPLRDFVCQITMNCTAALLKFDQKHILNKTNHWKEQTKFSKCTKFQSLRPKYREAPSF